MAPQPSHDSGDPAPATPVRPRLVVRIGVAGHRPNRLIAAAQKREITPGAHEAKLASALRSVLDQFAEDCASLHASWGGIYAATPPLLRLVSGAAMGVDQIASGIVARDLRGKLGPVDWQIDTILPASRRAFALDALPDFDQMFPGISEDCRNTDCTNHWSEVYARADALLTLPAHWRKSEGPPHTPCDEVIFPEDWGEPLDCPEPDHTLDHTLAAEFLIRQIDALIIIWDGKPGAGPGGTPDIASAALEQGLPVIHIDPTDASMEPRMLTRVLKADAPRGIRNWYARAIDLECEEADARKGAIREGLQRVLGFPAAKQQSVHAAGHGRDLGEQAKLDAFYLEPRPAKKERDTYALFRALMLGDIQKAATAICSYVKREAIPEQHWSESEWAAFVADAAVPENQRPALKAILRQRFAEADLLAVRYADRYREMFIGIYVLAAFAVLIALAGFLLPKAGWALGVKLGLVIAELLVLGMIWRLVERGRSQRLHERFVEYRALAEGLRQLRCLAPFAQYAAAGATGRQPTFWWHWYLRATARELGLPGGALDASYQRSLLSSVIKHEIDGQKAYHISTQAKEEDVEHGIHRLGGRLFWTTVLILLLGGVLFAMVLAFPTPLLQGAAELAKPLVGILAAALPAIGSALVGIRFTADFDGKAKRSAAMLDQLQEQRRMLEEAKARQDFVATQDALLGTASLLAEDVQSFMALYGRKQLTLPA